MDKPRNLYDDIPADGEPVETGNPNYVGAGIEDPQTSPLLEEMRKSGAFDAAVRDLSPALDVDMAEWRRETQDIAGALPTTDPKARAQREVERARNQVVALDVLAAGPLDQSYGSGYAPEHYAQIAKYARIALFEAQQKRDQTEQTKAVPRDQATFGGELARGLMRGFLGTGPEMIGSGIVQWGKSSESEGLEGAGEVLRFAGKEFRKEIPAQSAPQFTDLGVGVSIGAPRSLSPILGPLSMLRIGFEKDATKDQREHFWRDFRQAVGNAIGEGIGTSAAFLLTGAGGRAIAGKIGQWLGGVGAGVAMGHGQMRQRLEEEFAKQGSEPDEALMERYVYTFGTAIGMLEYLTEMRMLRELGPDQKKIVGDLLAKRIAERAAIVGKEAALGMVMEGTTEALQDITEILGTNMAFARPMDWEELRKTGINSFLGGAFPGGVFGTVGGAREAYAAKYEPQKPAGAPPSPAAPTEPDTAEQPPTATLGDGTPEFQPMAARKGRKREPQPGFNPYDAPEPTLTAPESEPVRALRTQLEKVNRKAKLAVVAEEAGFELPDSVLGGTLAQIREAIIDAAKAARDEAAPVAQPVQAPVAEPSFQDVRSLLPRDEMGDPDVGKLAEMIQLQTGKPSWASLSPDEKRDVAASFGWQAPAPEVAPALAEPAASQAPAAPASGAKQAFLDRLDTIKRKKDLVDGAAQIGIKIDKTTAKRTLADIRKAIRAKAGNSIAATPSQEVKPQEGERGPDHATARAPVREGEGDVSEGSVPGVRREDGEGQDVESVSQGTGRDGGRDGGEPARADDDAAGPAERDVPGAATEVQPDSARGGRDRQERDPVRDAVAAELAAQEQARIDRRRRNYRITDADEVGKGGAKAKVRANIAAIETLKRIEDEGREATDDERKVLVKYVGWGAFAQDVFADHKPDWAKERQQLKDMLTAEEYASARRSTMNAHYTSPEVIKGIWQALDHLGFTGGRVLEPSAGIGHFIGLQPDHLIGQNEWTAVELDTLTGRMLKALHSGSDVRVQGFQDYKVPDNFFDLAISNVPFEKTGPHDPRYKTPLSLHDYFFVKSLDKVRPGGLVAFVTSSYTLDKVRDRARQMIADRADFVGAIRLPGGSRGAFKANAGTDVTTDVIFLRKRQPGEAPSDTTWLDIQDIRTPEGPTPVNAYYAQNPEMMLGKMRLTGSQWSAGEPVLIGSTENLDQKITEAAQNMPANVFLPRGQGVVTNETLAIDTNTDGIKEGAFYVKDGKIYRKVMGVGQAHKISQADARKVTALIGVRDVVNEMLAKQARGDKTGMGDLRRRLGTAYDAFVKKNGPINKLIVSTSTRTNKAGQPIVTRRMPNFSAFSEDPDAYKVAAIEAYDEESGAARKNAIFFEDIVGSYQTPEITGPADALAVSLNETGKIDIPLMAERLGLSEAEVIADLGNAVYLNPNGDTWERASDYLSGDVVRKLEEAREAASADARYERNVEALEAVQPPPLTQIDIRVNFGAPWIPKEDYQAFLAEVLGAYSPQILYSQVSKTWHLGERTSFPQSAQARFGTDRVYVDKIVEAALNGKPIQVKDKLADGSSVVNDAATQEAQAKVQALLDTFQGNPDAAIEPWVWQDEARAERLEKIYNAAFNRLVKTTYDGSHLTLPGMATSLALSDGRVVPFSLRAHQKNAVWRMIVSGNTLLDHTVGAGKTFTMIAGAMELKRLGLVQRPMFVVPNHMLEQFSREFLQAYPGAKLLVATKKQMSKARRKEFAARVAADKWDGIIITHSSFGRIGVSSEAEVAYLESELSELREVLDTAIREGGRKAKTVKEIEKAISKGEERMKKLMASERKDEGVTFEELGVDHLIVDEAHAYKNLPVFTKHTRIKGIGTKPSQRATDLFMKIRILEAAKPGRAVTFATGTPMSRSMAELFTMQRYLQLETLKEYGIEQFDAWAATFGRIVTKSELSIDGRGLKETTSFSKFVNIPELVAIYSKVADTMSAADLNLPRPTLAGGKVQIETVDLNDEAEQKVQEIIRGIESLKGVRPEKGAPNHLSYFTKGLQVSTDLRLLDPSAPFDPNGKIGKVLSNVFDIWKNGKKPALAQMIFLDMGVPNARTKAKGAGPVEEDASQIDTVRAKLLGEDVAEAEDAEELTEDDLEDAAIEAQLEGAFNLYDDIRERLVARGVPREQIAFIHEAPTDEKKALLFKDVREGKVRIIIGSSGKMGVGTNVQKYLVAMHHVDAPWNPADVEQRDGRILRQGNENKEVSIFRYVTKRSFEAYRWQLLDRKAQFVADFRAGARGVREAEDIDSPLPEASELKAAATGNPYIMEFADLTKEVRDLENAKRAGERSVYQAKRSLESTRADLEQSQKYEAAYAEDAKKVVDLTGKAFKATLNVGPKPGAEVTERKEFGEIVRDYIVEQGRYIYSSTPQSRTVGEISGFPIKLEIRSSGEGLQVQFGIDGAAQYRSSGGYMLMTGEANPVVVAQRIEGLVRGVPILLQQARDRVAKAEADIPRLERQSRPVAFPREARLQEAKARLDEVKKLLNPPKEGDGPAEKAVMAALIGDQSPATGEQQRRVLDDLGFYDKIVPTALKKIIKGEPIKVETLDSPSGKTGLGKGFTLFPLTPELKARILSEGQPMFALKSDKAERDAFKAKLEAGKTATVKKSVQEGMRAFLQKAPALLPAGSPIGFMKRAKPIGNGFVRVTYELQDGTEADMELEVSFLLGSWAFFDPDSGFIGFHRLAFSPDLVGTLSGQLYHEVLHWLRTNGLLRGATWRRLLDHATRLRVLDMKWRTYLQVRGDPHYVRVTDGRTVGEMYAAAYQHIQDFDKINEYLDQESVAIMLEVHALGIPLSGIEQLSDILMAIDNGSMARGDYSPRSLGVSPEDTMTPGMWTHLAINAWHGSPHDFDRFSMEHIGRGEGAQAFGHGLYFGEAKGTGQRYQDILSKHTVRLRGVENPTRVQQDLLDMLSGVGADDRLMTVAGLRSELKAVVRDSEQAFAMYGHKATQERIAKFKAYQAELEKIADQIEIVPGGHLYEVRLDVDHADLLDWDKPLGEQGDVGRKAALLAGPLGPADDALVMRGHWRASDLIERVRDRGGSKADLSQMLRDAGIPGIRYLDQASRGAGEGTRNIVIFDDSLVEIISKDGKPVSKAERAQVIEQMKGEQSDLDMSPEARKARAEELGFDTRTVYHHTSNSTFDAFDLARGEGALGPSFAKGEAVYQGPHMGQYYLRLRNSLSFNTGFEVTPRELVRHLIDGRYTDFNGDVKPVGLEISPADKKVLAATIEKNGWDADRAQIVRDVLRRHDIDGFEFVHEGMTEAIVFDPSSIRSVNAAFDPAESASSKLMAALGPSGGKPSFGKAIREWLGQRRGETGRRDDIRMPPAMVSRARFDEMAKAIPRKPRAVADVSVIADKSGDYVQYFVVPRGQRSAWAKDGSSLNHLGSFSVTRGQHGGIEVTYATLEDHMQRRGIGSTVYDLIERDFPDATLMPSPWNQLSEAAVAFWSKRAPERLTHQRARAARELGGDLYPERKIAWPAGSLDEGQPMFALGPQQQRPAATAIASGEALREEMEASGMVTEEGAPVLFGLDEVPEIDPEAVESDPGRVDTFVSWWSLEDDAKAVVREITGFDETYAADWIEPHIGLRILNGPDGKPMMAHLDVRDPFSVLIDVPDSATRGRAPVLPPATAGSIQANAIVGGPRLQGARTPRPGPGAEQPLNSIADLVTKFNKALGLTTRVGRLDPRLKAAAGRAGGKLFGQFSTRTGVVRLRLANDFDVLTHEGGHSLETRLGRSLEALKQKHRSEIEPLATTLIGQKLSEGFAEFFRLYITNPTFAQRAAPKFFADFEALLGQQASLLPAKRGVQRTMLDDIADVQSAYENYLIAPSQGRTVRNQVLVHRMGGVRAFLDKVTETGFVRAFTDRAHRLYDYLVASDHSWYMATRKLLDLAEANTGQRIDLRAIDNPGKLFRRLSHTKSWAMADMLRGVMLPGHTDPSGPSLSEALSDAFGGQEVGKWTEAAFKDFGQYLIARRAILLYVRHNSRLARTVQNFVQQNPSLQYLLAKLPAPGGFDLPAPPTAESLLDHLNTVRDLEASHPSYRAAADKVYAFNRNILTLLRHAGLLSDAQYQHYTTAETDWVPFARDMRDEGALQDPLQGPSGMATDLSQVNKRSILGRIKGSSRPIINPIQSLMQYVFEVRLRVATNETVKALADLAAGAGAGPSGFAGAIFEPLPANEARAMQVKVFDALRSAAKDAGMTDIDTDVMLANVETYLDKNAVTTLFTMGQAKEAGEPIVWYWQDGKPIPGRLGDGDLGRLMFLSLTSSGQRSSSFLLKAAAMPAIMVRTGATKWFDFIFANLIRDAFATAANSPFAWPFYTQFQGLREVLTSGKYLHMYEHYAGMMGGELTQAIEDSSIERDIDALRKEGVRVVRVTDFRTFLKAAGQYGKAALQWSEFSETATRVGVFKAAYDRAIADGLPPGEAVYEAAHEAHDIIDFSRHGSKTEVIRRVIPFWNAWLQGTTKYVRALTAQSDQGNAFIKWRNGDPLTRAEQVDLERSMKAWAWTFVGLGTFSLIVAALNAGDDDMDEVSDRVRATHWVIKLQGALHLIPKSWDVFGLADKGKDIKVRIPKPFEIAWFANAVERAFDGAARADPKAFQRWLHDFWEITSPPSGVTALDTAYGLRAGEDFFAGRSIVPFWEAQEERPDQFGPYTSETAKRIGKLLNVSSYYVDNVIRGLGASMGRDLTALADRHLFGKEGAPSPRLDEIVIARRFLQNPAKGSRSISEFFDLYRGRGGFSGWFWDTFSEGARSYYAAAKRYKDALDSGRDAQAAEYLASFTDDQKAYALLMSKRGRGAAGYRALHPLENTRIFVEQSNAILKEMLMDGISTGSRKPGAPKKFIDLDPAQKGIIRHELMQARMAAAQNGLRILGVDGWAQRQPLDMGVRLEVVRQASQEVYDELQRRLKKKHFLPFEGVARTWKATRDRLVSDGRNAVLGDLKADAATQ